MWTLVLFAACTGPLDAKVPVLAEPDTAEVDTGPVAVERCGTITEDQTWGAARPQHVTCDVVVAAGTLTIEAGAAVTFDEGVTLSVATEDVEAGFVVDGATAGVVFAADGDQPWGGVVIGDTAADVAITGLSIKGTTGGVTVIGAEIGLGSLTIDGASGGCGLTLKEGGTLAEGATGLSVTGAGGWAVCGDVATADRLPGAASSYLGNGLDGVYLSGSTLGRSATWEDLGVPYVIAENVDVAGTAEAPAVLTMEAGVAVRMERDRALRFSKNGGASQLVVNGTVEAPVTFDGLGAETAGYWCGIAMNPGAATAELHHLTVAGAGACGPALEADGAPLLVDDVTVTRAAEIGIELKGGAVFAPGSAGLAVTESGVPIVLAAAAVPSLPTAGLVLEGNTTAAVKVDGDATVSASGTWPRLPVPYWLASDVRIDGTAEATAVLTLAAGTSLLVDNDVGFYVGKSGAAALVAAGTSDDPITMEPWSAFTPGAWAGVGFYDHTVDAESVLNNVEIGYAGGTSLKGCVQLTDASPALSSVRLHDGAEWGLYLSGSSAPTLADVTYENNGSGTCNACD